MHNKTSPKRHAMLNAPIPYVHSLLAQLTLRNPTRPNTKLQHLPRIHKRPIQRSRPRIQLTLEILRVALKLLQRLLVTMLLEIMLEVEKQVADPEDVGVGDEFRPAVAVHGGVAVHVRGAHEPAAGCEEGAHAAVVIELHLLVRGGALACEEVLGFEVVKGDGEVRGVEGF
jgi:hypothetical protein